VTDQRVRTAVLDAVRRVAPDVDVETLDPEADLRREADLDSVDVANLVVRLRDVLGVDVPETEYDELTTVDRAVAYLERRIEQR
jgi:acyl carrier protein